MIKNDEYSKNQIFQLYAKKSKLNIKILYAYIDAFIHESGDSIDNNQGSKAKYINGSPSVLPIYCKEYDTDIPYDSTLKLTECKGCSGQTHLFMIEEGITTCTQCKCTLCQYCIATMKKGTKRSIDFYLECYSNELIGCKNELNENSVTNAKIEKKLLDDHNVNDVSDLPSYEVYELYNVLYVKSA